MRRSAEPSRAIPLGAVYTFPAAAAAPSGARSAPLDELGARGADRRARTGRRATVEDEFRRDALADARQRLGTRSTVAVESSRTNLDAGRRRTARRRSGDPSRRRPGARPATCTTSRRTMTTTTTRIDRRPTNTTAIARGGSPRGGRPSRRTSDRRPRRRGPSRRYFFLHKQIRAQERRSRRARLTRVLRRGEAPPARPAARGAPRETARFCGEDTPRGEARGRGQLAQRPGGPGGGAPRDPVM